MAEPLSYASLGVRRVINAAATLTVLGGSVMPDEVLDAMRAAAGCHVGLHELEAAGGAEIAPLTDTECGTVATGALSLSETVRIAHARGIPVVADAAAQLPPPENLWAFTQAGADLVIFSGGKALRGPQASGLVLGQETLIEAVRANGAPHQRL